MSLSLIIGFLKKPFLPIIAGATLFLFSEARPVLAQATVTIAQDSAQNYDGQTEYAASNGGSGFSGPFTFTGSGSEFLDNANTNGFTGGIGYINSANGISFGLYGQETATRQFTLPLTPGETFSLDFDNGFVSSGQSDTYQLLNSSGASVFTFGFTGGGNSYKANGVDTGLGFTSDGLSTSLTITSPTTYSFSVTKLGNNSGSYSGTGTFSGIGPITAFSVTNPDANGGTGEKLFFNNVSVAAPASAPEPSPMVTLSMGLLGICGLARARRRRS